MSTAHLPLIRRPHETERRAEALNKPEDGAVRLCILAAHRMDDAASAGLLIAAVYAPPPLIRAPVIDEQL